jgi:hypothetical protein
MLAVKSLLFQNNLWAEIDSAHCINKAMSCSGANDVDYFNEEVLNCARKTKIGAGPTPYRDSAKTYSPTQF